MKRILIIIVIILFPYISWAVKANGSRTLIEQSDGTHLIVKLVGDENFHYAVTTDGVILYHAGNDYFIGAIDKDGTLSPTTQLAHEKNLRSDAEESLISQQDVTLFYQAIDNTARKQAMRKEAIRENSTYFPHSGTPTALVLLVDFTDSVFSLDNPKIIFDKYLNASSLSSEDGSVADNYGSVAQYFSDMSFGAFRPKFDLYGPARLQHPLKYYGNSENMYRFIPDACNAFKDSIDFSKYDENGDGYIDLIYVIYAGYSESWSKNSTECLWPKSGTINIDSLTLNGKHIYRYGINNELNAYPGAFKKAPYKRCNGIGLFCHEFSHCLGLPDLYSTTENPLVPTLEYWDLMDGGEYSKNGYSPCTYSAWEREALGWMSLDTLKSAQTVTLKPVQDGGKAYRIMNDKDSSGHEYYIVENRQKRGWNQNDYGHGMLVYHVDYNANSFSLENNSVNNTTNHPRMTLVAADGKVLNSYTIGDVDQNGDTITQKMYRDDMKGDPFPGVNGNKYLTDTSAVASVVYTGTYISKPVVEISEDTLETDNYASVTFKFYPSNEAYTTRVQSVPVIVKDNGRIYTIDGIYVGSDVNRLKKGIYIRNRQKIII